MVLLIRLIGTRIAMIKLLKAGSIKNQTENLFLLIDEGTGNISINGRTMITVVFTCGDINGIGPEIAVKAFSKIFIKKNNNQIIFICPKNVFEYYYKH